MVGISCHGLRGSGWRRALPIFTTALPHDGAFGEGVERWMWEQDEIISILGSHIRVICFFMRYMFENGIFSMI